MFPSIVGEKDESFKDVYKKIVEVDFIHKVSNNVHVKIDIDNRIIPDFYLNFHLDAIGKNGVLYLAQYLDFTKVHNATIFYLLVTNESLNKLYNRGKINKVYIFGNEPVFNTEEHKKWDYLHSLEGFNLRHPSESSAVADEMLLAGVKKFLEV